MFIMSGVSPAGNGMLSTSADKTKRFTLSNHYWEDGDYGPF